MKIAEALRQIKNLKGKLSRAWALVENNSYFVEGKEKPEFDVKELLPEIERLTNELRNMKLRVQRTNLQVEVGKESLAGAIIRLGDLRGEVAKREQIFRARPDNKFLHEEEVIYGSAVPEQEQVKTIEEVGLRIEQLDNSIQKANWQFDVE